MAKLSEEERIIRRAERESNRELKLLEKESRREQKAKEKSERDGIKAAKKQEKERPEKTEADLVRDYANRVIKNASYHGRIDSAKFEGLEHNKTVSKNLWMDNDFFFSVVFQSADQKRQFLRKFLESFKGEVSPDEDFGIQILNGLELAEVLGIELKKETSKDYPTASIDLLPLVLDNESTL